MQELSNLWKEILKKIGQLMSKYNMEIGDLWKCVMEDFRFRIEFGTKRIKKFNFEIEMSRFDNGLYGPELDQRPWKKCSLWDILFGVLGESISKFTTR